MKLDQTINKIKECLKVNKENLPRFLILILIIGIVIIGSVFFNLGPKFFAVTLSILFIITWWKAGVVVFKSLIEISVGLTIILYLSELYCKTPRLVSAGDDALKTLIGFGLIYIGITFFKSLWKALMGNKDENTKGDINLFKEVNGGKHSFLILIPYVLFVGLFIYQLWQVIDPILDNLCIYT